MMSRSKSTPTRQEGRDHLRWQAAVNRCERMLVAVENATAIEGQEWAAGMRRHWTRRLATLRNNEPSFTE